MKGLRKPLIFQVRASEGPSPAATVITLCGLTGGYWSLQTGLKCERHTHHLPSQLFWRMA